MITYIIVFRSESDPDAECLYVTKAITPRSAIEAWVKHNIDILIGGSYEDARRKNAYRNNFEKYFEKILYMYEVNGSELHKFTVTLEKTYNVTQTMQG